MRSSIGDSLLPGANNLNLLRLTAACAVLVSHCGLLKIGTEEAEPLASVMVYSFSDHALHAFFFISGFTIAASLARADSYVEFFAARVLRIWPALMVISAILALGVAPVLGDATIAAYFVNPAWAEYITKASFLMAGGMNLPGLFIGNPHLPVANGSTWTLKYEVICYGLIAVGAICSGGRKKLASTRLLEISTVAAAGLIMITAAGRSEATLGHLARFWFAFGLGALSWKYADRLRPSLWMVASIGVCLWLSLGGGVERLLSIVFTGALVLFFADLPTGWLRRFTNRTDLSYGVYVTAWPITQAIIKFFPEQPLWTVTIATLLISSAFAYLSWSLVEKPAMSLRPRLVLAIKGVACLSIVTPFRRNAIIPVVPDKAASLTRIAAPTRSCLLPVEVQPQQPDST